MIVRHVFDSKIIESAMKSSLKSNFQLIKDITEGKVETKGDGIADEIVTLVKEKIYSKRLRVSQVGVYGVRGIEDITLSIEDDLTVIIGNNGSGKSTILDSLSLTLSWLKASILKEEGVGTYLRELDINNSRDVSYGSVTCRLCLEEENFNFLSTKSKPGRSLSRRSALQEIKALGGLYRHVNSQFADSNLPLVAHYSVARSNEGTKDDFAKVGSQIGIKDKWGKFDAYEDVLKDRHDFNEFIVWLGRIDSIARQGGGINEEISKLQSEINSTINLLKMFKDKGNDQSFILPLEEIIKKKNKEISNIYNENFNRDEVLASKVFKHIKQAITIFIPDINDVRLVYEQEGVKLVLYKNNKEISAQQLSQGEKSLLSLIGDLTRRLVLLNPSLDNPLEGEGIVLIDEIDLHLHPSWQQTVILNLQNTFPNLQLIVTTHSPQVLSTVYSRSIRSLHEVNDVLNTIPSLDVNNKIIASETPEFQTRGVMSTDILSKIMGIDPVPLVKEAKWVQEYLAAIEYDKNTEGYYADLWADIVEHFGENHPVVISCKNAVRLKGMRGKIREMKKNKNEDIKKGKE
ncbi:MULTISPECIES: AAA family ATPase [Klebsiella]|jgi:Predicted ATP-binding protein involved in virulence|nr:AAA family ATPase [Klebsiella aerogenes]EIW9477702.1 AAA family ATPase [Klebsiella aerogenes]EIW9497905.1 AAA family ATPase [Klebsiella aerogenes]EKM7512377.1 AAA family ATPase [Klebsiella aerogenes]ELW9549871.1 AAA family ATPase [Klebsiella aerogenes]KUQ19156.1 hypothetical protein AWI09_10865 [Klebsiella aerogenes]